MAEDSEYDRKKAVLERHREEAARDGGKAVIGAFVDVLPIREAVNVVVEKVVCDD